MVGGDPLQAPLALAEGSHTIAGGDPSLGHAAPLNPNAMEFVQNQQASVNNPLLPIITPHLPWMPSLQIPIATTNQEIRLTTLNTSSAPTDWSGLTAMDACAAAGIRADSIPSDLEALFERTPAIMTSTTKDGGARPSTDSCDKDDEKAKRTIHIKGEETFKVNPLPKDDCNTYRK